MHLLEHTSLLCLGLVVWGVVVSLLGHPVLAANMTIQVVGYALLYSFPRVVRMVVFPKRFTQFVAGEHIFFSEQIGIHHHPLSARLHSLLLLPLHDLCKYSLTSPFSPHLRLRPLETTTVDLGHDEQAFHKGRWEIRDADLVDWRARLVDESCPDDWHSNMCCFKPFFQSASLCSQMQRLEFVPDCACWQQTIRCLLR